MSEAVVQQNKIRINKALQEIWGIQSGDIVTFEIISVTKKKEETI